MTTLILVQGVRDAEGEFRLNLAAGGKRFRSKFLEPGLVSYRDVKDGGIELLRKETIDQAITTAIGNPLTCGHVIVTSENRMNVEQGIIDAVDYDSTDGWYYANGDVDTEDARTRINAGEKPSCGYVVTSFGPGGTYHGIKYDREITGIHFNHLAIVKKPRYEHATFRLNSIVATPTMNVFKFLKALVTPAVGADGKPVTVAPEARDLPGETTVSVDGAEVRLNDLAECWRIQKNQVFECCATDQIMIDGAPVNMNELVDNYRKAGKTLMARENAGTVIPVVVPVVTPEPVVEATRENAGTVVPVVVPVTPPPTKEEKVVPFFQLRNARQNAVAEEQAAQASASRNQSSGSLEDRVKAGQARYGSVPTAGKN